MNNLRSETRGAALIVAILILAILLVIVLAFFQASRQEMHIASNYRNAIQADLLAEGGTAIAQAFLNHDFLIHPTATSLDGAWKTYFNNAWAVGKPYLWANGNRLTRENNGYDVPLVNLDALPDIGDYFYVPRVQPTSDTGPPPTLAAYLNYPFAVDYAGGQSGLLTQGLSTMGELAADNYGVEHIHAFADWDNDGDSFRDSAWIPMPMDRFFPNDGIDNDLDGYIDEGVEDGFDGDGNGIIDDPGELNQPVERGLFVYWGGDDGLDNDGDGVADEADERRPYLTTPLGPIDMDGNGTFENLDMFAVAYMDAAGVRLTISLNPNRGSSDIDRLDNDHDLVINEGNYHFYARPTTTPFTPDQAEYVRREEANGFYPIHPNYVDVSAIAPAPPPDHTWIVTFAGEPVCEIVGRVAILIKDENSKVNLNIAGGRNYRDYLGPSGAQGGLRRALWAGATPFEYENRVMPQLGSERTDRLWNLRMGAHAGIGFASIVDAPTYTDYVGNGFSYATPSYNFDASLPGYGRVDDNGNALWMAMDGIDNDGDGLVDEGLVDFDGGGIQDYEAWAFEGVDEPGEFQTYRPLRNTLAETDTIDNSFSVATDEQPPDRSIDEIGELGDRYLRTTEQMKLARNITEPFYNAYERVRTLATANALDLNARFRRFDDSGMPLAIPEYSGPKLDYNYALPTQIFDAVSRDWGYGPASLITDPDLSSGANPSPFQVEAALFALGLRREDTAVIPPLTGLLGGALIPDNELTLFRRFFPADPALRAAQLAVNIRDSRDSRMNRSELATAVNDDWWSGVQPGIQPARRIEYTQSGVESIRINEMMVRPVRRIEAETDVLQTFYNPSPAAGWPFSANYVNNFKNPAFSDPSNPFADRWVNEIANAWKIYNNQPASPFPRDWTLEGNVIGESSYVRATERELKHNTDVTLTVPNVIQFRFGACPGLPTTQPEDEVSFAADPEAQRTMGARYYLLMNTMAVDPATRRMVPTVTAPGQIRFAFKYATLSEPDILQDVLQGTEVMWRDNAVIGYRNMDNPVPGTESGMVFLPSDLERIGQTEYGADSAYTVHIPPVPTTGLFQQRFLYVAIQFNDPDPADPDNRIAINYFDFSQEPDHEWVELVNIAEGTAATDIGNWELAIGPQGNQTVMRIPGGTRIAPGGSLLLAFNKYDAGVLNNLLFQNDIALARGSYNMFITEPPIRGFDPLNPLDQTRSVFYRPINEDFIDNDGDGVPDPDDLDGDGQYLYDTDGDGVNDTDIADKFYQSTLDGITGVGANKSWDRIVQLEDIFQGDTTSSTDFERLARLVLKGGFLPNYPEHDNIDNDGDNAFLIADGIDNDGDGVVDESYLPDPVTGVIDDDEAIVLAYPVGSMGPDFRPEGVDEGRWDFAIDPNTLTPVGLRGLPAPGSYSEARIPYGYGAAGTPNAATAINAAYIPDDNEPPEWKEFVESHWFSGDNVIVTLYEGSGRARVVDRVTYSERDVVNRAIDDIVTCLYPLAFDESVEGLPADGIIQPYERHRLDSRYASFWPDNSMAFDFYRSVERKHPLYNGDLHGVRNRWQATDGNYDDWSPSTSVFERAIQFDPVTGAPIAAELVPRHPDLRFNHAFSGSPLRMNLAQRYMENAGNKFIAPEASGLRWAFERGRVRNNTYVSPGDLLIVTNFMDLREFADPNFILDDVPINYSRTGALLSDPVQSLALNERQDASIQGVLVGQHPYDDTEDRDDLQAVVSTTAMDPLVLTAGQANYYSILPQPSALMELAANWDGDAATAPIPWTPVFLFPLRTSDTADVTAADQGFSLDANSNYRYQVNPLENYLFTGPYGDGTTWLQNANAFPFADIPDQQMGARWPLQLRSVMYATGTPGATALFEWDGADGLENGDYDVYVSTIDDLSRLREAHVAAGLQYLTGFGVKFEEAARNTIPQNMVLDVEVFTDRGVRGQPHPLLASNTQGAPLGPNGRCWIDGFGGNPIDNYPQPDEFERGSDTGYYTPGDSYGMLVGKRPDEDGRVYYGTVRVENNYLAVLLRNANSQGQLMRFSRVILTPRPRTHGRININTAETVLADFDSSNYHDFNPLIGTPGLLTTVDAATTPPTVGYFAEGNISPSSPVYLTAAELARIVVQNRERPNADSTAFLRAHADGRYYDSTSDLVKPDPVEGYPDILTQNAWTDPGLLLDEMKLRYSRLANLATVRSDVFEITVTAQTGYVSGEDLNNDGRLDYRNDFIATGEKKLRTVYER